MLPRLADLSAKTNQFNLALRRLPDAAIAAMLENPASAVVAVGLKDVMSDSGVIAALFAEASQGDLAVRDLVVSCRALGRGIEDIMIATALVTVADRLPSTPRYVRFDYLTGPRNAPARDWLARFCGQPLQAGEGSVAIALDRLRTVAAATGPIAVRWISSGEAGPHPSSLGRSDMTDSEIDATVAPAAVTRPWTGGRGWRSGRPRA